MYLKDDLTNDVEVLRAGIDIIEKIFLGDVLVYSLSDIPGEYDEKLLYDINNIAQEFIT